MKETKHIVLTFDHELFLGLRSGSVDNCMIQPTTLLQEIFDDFGIKKAVFFLDTTYVSCLKRNFNKKECQKDYDLVKSNIRFSVWLIPTTIWGSINSRDVKASMTSSRRHSPKGAKGLNRFWAS